MRVEAPPPGPQVWAELADGSCRWRQTGGEVKVVALRVPPELPNRQLAVDIQPYSLKGAPIPALAGCSVAGRGVVERERAGLQQQGCAGACRALPLPAVLHPFHTFHPIATPTLPLPTHAHILHHPPLPTTTAVWNRATGEVYLEGSLERGVVPEDCFWTHCGGEGEDGCAIYLRKMNLEVLKK